MTVIKVKRGKRVERILLEKGDKVTLDIGLANPKLERIDGVVVCEHDEHVCVSASTSSPPITGKGCCGRLRVPDKSPIFSDHENRAPIDYGIRKWSADE